MLGGRSLSGMSMTDAEPPRFSPVYRAEPEGADLQFVAVADPGEVRRPIVDEGSCFACEIGHPQAVVHQHQGEVNCGDAFVLKS